MLQTYSVKKIDGILRTHARLCRIRIYHLVNVGNHLHLVIKLDDCREFSKFIRVITGLIARHVLRTAWDFIRNCRSNGCLTSSLLKPHPHKFQKEPARKVPKHRAVSAVIRHSCASKIEKPTTKRPTFDFGTWHLRCFKQSVEERNGGLLWNSFYH